MCPILCQFPVCWVGTTVTLTFWDLLSWNRVADLSPIHFWKQCHRWCLRILVLVSRVWLWFKAKSTTLKKGSLLVRLSTFLLPPLWTIMYQPSFLSWGLMSSGFRWLVLEGVWEVCSCYNYALILRERARSLGFDVFSDPRWGAFSNEPQNPQTHRLIG